MVAQGARPSPRRSACARTRARTRTARHRRRVAGRVRACPRIVTTDPRPAPRPSRPQACRRARDEPRRQRQIGSAPRLVQWRRAAAGRPPAPPAALRAAGQWAAAGATGRGAARGKTASPRLKRSRADGMLAPALLCCARGQGPMRAAQGCCCSHSCRPWCIGARQRLSRPGPRQTRWQSRARPVGTQGRDRPAG